MGRQANHSRREFLRKLGCSFACGSVASLVPQLAFLPRAMAQSAPGYKALVCIYLAGANDSYNWLVPRDSEAAGSRYDTYRSTRGGVYSASNTNGLALAYNELLPITPSNQSFGFGLHPSSTDFTATNGGASQAHSGIQTLFNSGKAAFVCNAGPLVQPITKAEYDAGAPRPPQLFSHNDQELQWHLGMSAGSHPMARYGWGGRVAKSTVSGSLPIALSPTISAAGSARFLIGDSIMPYQVSSAGVDLIDNYNATSATNYASARRAVLNDLLDESAAHPFLRAYGNTARRSLEVGEAIGALLDAPDGSGNVQAVFPTGNNLGEQLKMVARMIKVSRTLGATRQVYYVRMGSYDLHQGMFEAGGATASTGHGALLTTLNQALGAFWTALGEIGARSQVTTFTMSDFGRTLTGNGSGSDHAWGGNLLVVGDAVAGNKLYGTYPRLVVNSNDPANRDFSFSRGQYIPTTAVDQVAATLAKWMGVTDGAALGAIFPQLGNFATGDLGFMGA
ncbi:MAG: DUF1501 domain-containing protein [Xanthomonadales bacterium PRO6]|nr:hypothetical protein [Xanthomonadales bacterium]MCE7930010.1 DUF1501 domain-containing protein [Xanthomonadales bacterium PRO6]